MKSYEQRYKAALEWMQGLYSGLHGATKEEAEHYFPELKESEGERIRKAIIEFFKLQDDNTTYSLVSKKDIIAWLEMQGGQTHAKLGQSEVTKTSDQELSDKIDVRTMAAWQSGYKEAIEKACEWLDCYIDNYLFIDAENKSGIKWDNFINDFRKAMKSGSSEFPNNCEKGGEA